MVKKLFLLIAMLLLGIIPAQAQQEVRATVNYATVNLRDAPNAESATHWTGTSNILAQLSQGEAVIVHAVETVPNPFYSSDESTYGYTWIYVTVPSRNLSGWVVGEYLTFEAADWDQHVEHLESWQELVNYIGLRLPETGIAGKTTNFCGWGSYFFPLFNDPVNFKLVSKIPIDTPIMILGRAEIDGKISGYLYIRSQDGQHEGWLDINDIGEVVYTIGCGAPDIDYFQALPIIYTDTAPTGIPHPYGVVEITAVNLRSAPGTDSTILRELPYQTHLELHSITSYEKEEAWVNVTVPDTGESGWVFAKYLSYWVVNWNRANQSDRFIEGLPLSAN